MFAVWVYEEDSCRYISALTLDGRLFHKYAPL